MAGHPAAALIHPDWPAPPTVRAVATTRIGGCSRGPWAGLNLGDHVGDDPAHVADNRARLVAQLALPTPPVWLRQVHGTAVVRLPAAVGTAPEADAAVAGVPGVVCAVLSADCLPVLLCDRAGRQVAAVHAGWRGLAAGVIEAAIRQLAAGGAQPAELLAWLGPAIGVAAYEVGDEVRAAFLAADPGAGAAFRRRPGAGRWSLDLCAAARLRLAAAGVAAVFGGRHCTHADARRFYSHRRDAPCGRQASLIWLAPA